MGIDVGKMGTARNSQKSENGGGSRNVNHLWGSWDLKMKVVGPKHCEIMEK